MIIDLTGRAEPCPICGSKRIYIEDPVHDIIFSIKIRCADCGLTGFKTFTQNEKDPVEKTVKYWNTRVPMTE